MHSIKEYKRENFIIQKKAQLTSLKLAKLVAELASNKKAENIKVLDMRKVVNFCDYFVICAGTSTRHVSAISADVQEQLAALGMPVYHKQGLQDARWVILDLGSVVLHVFEPETREFYNLDYLWQEAKEVAREK